MAWRFFCFPKSAPELTQVRAHLIFQVRKESTHLLIHSLYHLIMVDVVSSTKSLIEGCLRAYQDFCTLRTECASFRKLLQAVVGVLEDIEEQFRDGALSGNTSLQRPMTILRTAVGDGGEVLRKCTKTKKVLTLVFSKQLLGTLNKASQDVNQALLLLSASGVNIQGSISLQIEMVGKMVGLLQTQIQSNKHEVAEMVREANRQGCDDLARAVAEKLVAMQVVGSVEDFKDQQKEIQQECERLRSQKVVYDEEIMEAVRTLSLQECNRPKPPERQHSDVSVHLECPISKEIMRDPVTLVDSGHTYDREYLCRSLLAHPDLEPLTGTRYDRPLSYTDNIFARSMILRLKGDNFYQKYDDRTFRVEYKKAWERLRKSSEPEIVFDPAEAPAPVPHQHKESINKIFAYIFGSNESKIDKVRAQQCLDGEDESPVVLALKGMACHPTHDYLSGVAMDRSRALSLFQSALDSGLKQEAKRGDCWAQFLYGQLCEEGSGVDKNEGEAARFYKAAADQGASPAQCALGLLYHQGNGVVQDYATAVKLFEQAADQGMAAAQTLLGLLFKMGQGVPRDFIKAAHMLRLAADQGEGTAQNHLGLMYLNGNEGVAQNLAEAARLFELGANQGVALAAFNLGFMYYGCPGVAQDFSKAVHFFQIAADKGLAVAQQKLGEMHQNGWGVAKNYTEAARHFRLAADQGLPDAQRTLATLHTYGLGVPRDFNEANRLLQLANQPRDEATLRALGL